jgi:WD40 repeat protein
MPRLRTIRGKIALLLATLIVGPSASGDTYRVKTDRGDFLVEADGPDVVARAEGTDLVISRGGEEYRLGLDSLRDDVVSREPLLTVRRDGKAIVTARRIATALASPTASTPGRTVLNPNTRSMVWSLAMTPDGKTLVSGHRGGGLRVWDLATLAERYNVPIDKTVRRVSITPDGSTIATAEYSQIDGKTIGNVAIRDGKTGDVRRTMPPVADLHGVAIDPTGKIVVSCSWSEPGIRVWDVETGEQVGTLKGHVWPVGTVAYSPDGKTLASCGDKTVRLWHVDTGKVRKVFQGHQDAVESVAFSADGKTVASGGLDHDARVWDVETGKGLAILKSANPVVSVALSADGKTVATASARWGHGFHDPSPALVQTWEVATGKVLATLPEQPAQVFSMVFSPDGKSLFTASLSGAVTRWDLAASPIAKDASKTADIPKNK